MGNRKISFEPPARFFGLVGLIAMKVSLCGPHSFDTSTLLPKLTELVVTLSREKALLETIRYLSHQVGLRVLLFCEKTSVEQKNIELNIRIVSPSFRIIDI